MIYTIEYSASDMDKLCYGCIDLKLEQGEMIGSCQSTDNRVKNRTRSITDKACVCKRVSTSAGEGAE